MLYFEKMKMIFSRKEQLEIFENAISWIVVFAMFIYGGAKLMQFKGAAAIDKSVAELTGMELMWAFYGHSQTFAITLGIFEVTGGLLILIKRTRLLGCLFTSTILVNVILQDIFYEVARGALYAALLYQFLILLILWLNRQQVMDSLSRLLQYNPVGHTMKRWLLKLTLAFVLFVIFRIAEYYLTIVLL